MTARMAFYACFQNVTGQTTGKFHLGELLGSSQAFLLNEHRTQLAGLIVQMPV